MNKPNPEEIRESLFLLLQEIAPEIDPREIRMDEPFRDQVDIDSMDFLKFMTQIYETLGVNIPESDYRKISTLKDLVSYLSERIS